MDGCCRYEPSLDDLLADEMMEPVLKSAGFDSRGFREMMVETARRFEHRAHPGTLRDKSGERSE
ncbi:MAG: hypothetical protein ACREE4_06130 [Stellaceae bacterium]